ncbi:uncharacterized protein LOC141915186 [Tubulanus polymorphus]|uniref:uncharacterized protein LOC141915186 n=1 Tax=Tubulanus polymorphus TaxID=672921 RepID=UPI003DA3C4CC
MSTTMVSAFYDVDVLYQNRKNMSKLSVGCPPPMAYAEPKLIGCPMTVNTFPRARGFNTAAAAAAGIIYGQSQHQQHTSTISSLTSLSTAEAQDRANRSGNINSSRYKTELCRPFEENGHCKYGDKCQFAHGAHELRSLARHPKYKTELCRTFHTVGFCPYGPRCHFIHNEDERKLSEMKPVMPQQQQPQPQPAVRQAFTRIPQIQQSQSQPVQRPKSLAYRMSCLSMGSNAESPSSSLSSSPQSNSAFFDEAMMSANMLWLLNQRNNTESLVRDEVFSAPPSPPSSPVHSSASSSTCNSPISEKGLRLPIFRRLSLDDY